MTSKLKSKLISIMSVLTGIFLLFGAVIFIARKPVKAYAEDSEKTIDLYVIAGQSNAAGHTSNPSNTTFNSDVDYYAIAGTGATQQSTDFSKVAYGKGSRDANSFGPEIGIANAIAKSGRTNEAVIYKYAIGGTYLYPVSGKDTWANALYDNWKNNLSIVVNHYTTQGYTVNLMGTFWMQGEADSEQEAYYNAYADNLTALINNMRSDYAALSVRNASAPFVIGKIAANYGNKETTTGVAAIRAAQDNVAKSLADKNVFAIETAKVAGTGGDNYHFGTEEMQDVGLRAGNTMIENNDFVMAYGASIRKTEPRGIRFSATISASKYAEITENGAYKDGYKAGMIIVPAQYFTDYKAQSDVTDYYAYFNTVKGKMIDLPFAADQIVALDNGDYRINGAIVNIKEANFALDYQAVAYIAKTDETGTTYEYSNVSESRNVKYVAKKAIESGELNSAEAKLLCETYNLTYSDISVTADEKTYTFRTVGDVTLQEVSNLIYSQYGAKIVEFEGKSLTDVIGGTAEGNVVALNGYVGAFVTVKVNGEVTQTIAAKKGTGLSEAITEPSGLWAYEIKKDGTKIDSLEGVDFTALTEDTTISYSYYSGGTCATFNEGKVSLTSTKNQFPRQYFGSVNPAEGFSGQYTIEDGVTSVAFALTDGTNNVMAFVVSTKNVRYTVWGSGSYDPWTTRKDFNTLEIASGLNTLNYYYSNGSLVLYTDMNNVAIIDCITTSYTGTEKNVSVCLDATKTWRVGFWTWNNATTPRYITDLQINKGAEPNLLNCFKGKHVDNDKDDKCDYCGKDLPRTVNVTFDYSGIGGTSETIVATYGKGLVNNPTVPESKWAITCDYTGDYTNLTEDLTVKYSYVSKDAKISGDAVTLTSSTGDGYAYLAGSGSAVYLKAKLNITGDHQGIVIYTGNDPSKNNATIGFQHQGYALRQGYIWKAILTGNNAVFQKNGLLGIATADKGEHTVEYFIIGGKLYVIYDGTNLFGKPLTLSELSSEFTASANYHIGLSAYNATTTHTALDVAFGNDAIEKYNHAVNCASGTHADNDGDNKCDYCGKELIESPNS